MAEKYPPLIALGPFEGLNTSENDLLAKDSEAISAPFADPFRSRGALSTGRGRVPLCAGSGAQSGWLICSGQNATLKQAGPLSAISTTPSAVLPSAPTPGSLLVVEILLAGQTNIFVANPTLLANAGWTLMGYFTGGSAPHAAIAWKIAAPGDTATLAPVSNFGGTNSGWSVRAFEFIGYNPTTPLVVSAAINNFIGGTGGFNVTCAHVNPLAGSLGFQGGSAYFIVNPPAFDIPPAVGITTGFNAWANGPFLTGGSPPHNRYEVFTSAKTAIVSAAESTAGIAGSATLATCPPIGSCDTFMSTVVWFVQPGLSGC